MIHGNNGPITPQVGYYNGYTLEDRLLEDVRFRFQTLDNKLVWTGFHPADEDYMKKFSDLQIKTWYEEAYDCIMQGFEMQTADGEEDLYWVDSVSQQS
jgi:hypothetical protein